VVRERAVAEERLEHGRLGLLGLQQERVLVVASEQEHDPRARPDAAHADHLAGRMDVPEALQQAATVAGQRPPVRADHAVDERVQALEISASGRLLDGDDERRVAQDPPLSVHHVGELAHGSKAVLGSRLGDTTGEALPLLAAGLARPAVLHVVDGEARVPEVHRAHLGEPVHRLAVGAGRGEVDLAPAIGVEAAVASGDGEAGDQPFEVPLERPRQGLVEVVDAEHQSPVGGGEHAEVRQVRVTAQLDLEAGVRPLGEIGGHQQRGAPEERERRDEHAPVADRDQLRQPCPGLRLEQIDRIAAVGRRLPPAVDAPPDLGSSRLSPCGALRRRRVLDAGDAAPAATASPTVGVGPAVRPTLTHRGAHASIQPADRPRRLIPFG